MPWRIAKQGSQFCVVKDPSGEKVKCHGSKPEALAHLRALYANVPDARPKAAAGELDLVVDQFRAQHPFGRALVRLEPAGKTFTVAVAESLEARLCGMTGRRWQDGDFEAMLFAYEEPTDIGFHMNGVVEQLYIAWFDEQGSCIDHMGMFTSDPYTYKAQRPFKWALEMPAVDGGSAGGNPWAWLTGQTLHIEEAPA